MTSSPSKLSLDRSLILQALEWSELVSLQYVPEMHCIENPRFPAGWHFKQPVTSHPTAFCFNYLSVCEYSRQSFGIWRNTLNENVSTLFKFPTTMIAWAWKIKLAMPGFYAPFVCGRFDRGSRYLQIKAPWSRTEIERKFRVSKFSVKFLKACCC